MYSLVFPPRWELRRLLAEMMLALGVARSALEVFADLELWEAAMQCLRIIGEGSKAELLVRRRLEVAPSPNLWCALGDITGEDVVRAMHGLRRHAPRLTC